jgi:hypothetical protein
VTVHLINGVVVSDHMLRRLAGIDARDGVVRGCRNCGNLTLERLADAGLLDYERTSGTYRVTGAGRDLLAKASS